MKQAQAAVWTLNEAVRDCRPGFIHLHDDQTQQDAGHSDIVRELIDGSGGYLQGKDNMPPGDQAWWKDHRSRVERVPREVDG
ncbi:hypothetical protein ACFVTC_42000 [Streptomyces sp. NPDC057950]|uniref:hypothetical protein n=1 Tax=Streptomyces sp. NPDC057950 TaxID=3346288 RepID=UPI0036EB7446